MVDFFNRLDVPSLDPLGDTALPLRTASARQTAGVPLDTWRARVPVVFSGDGTQTQDALSAILDPNPLHDFQRGKQLGTSAGDWIADKTGLSSLVNHTLLGAAGIALLAVGAYVLLRD